MESNRCAIAIGTDDPRGADAGALSADGCPPDTDAGPPDADAGPPDADGDAGPPDADAGPPDPDLDQPDPGVSALGTPELEAALTTLAGHLNAATCRFLILLGEFDAREGWAVDGVRSCAHWLSWRCSIDAGTAREHLRVARALRVLPLTRAAFGAGRLSYSKVRAMTRVAAPDRELELVELALVTPAGPLERYLRGLSQSLDADDETRRHGNRRVTWRWAADGSLVLSARLSPDEGAIVVDALEATRDRLVSDESGARGLDEPNDPDRGPYQDPQDVPAETRTRRSLADALVAVCTEAVDPNRDDFDPNPTRRPELVIHVNLTDLTESPDLGDRIDPADRTDTGKVGGSDELAARPAGRTRRPVIPETMRGDELPRSGPAPRIEAGPALHRETARRLACDARIVLSVDSPTGKTLDLGRANRFPNAALTRLLWQRDGGCRYPGCERRRHLIAHHLVHWADGGPTSAANLVLLCGTHHRSLHEGRYRMSRSPLGALVFTSARGATITPAPPLAGDPHAAAASHTATVTAWTATPIWYGDQLDLDHAVYATRAAWSRRENAGADAPAGTHHHPDAPAGTHHETHDVLSTRTQLVARPD